MCTFYYNFLLIADANLKVKINVYCSEEINVITKFYNFVLTVNDCYNWCGNLFEQEEEKLSNNFNFHVLCKEIFKIMTVCTCMEKAILHFSFIFF